ncbi:MAG: DUF1549 domain-containing protein, partial [Akkermansiaceae bacterium]|nr:DUF1549 domain-containing protein [Akkermansiaceae bacterium]
PAFDFGKFRREHWAFRPVEKPAPPPVEGDWAQSPIDHFVLARLESAGMSPVPAADKRTLLRRASFTLTGLPPSPEEVEAFLADDAPDAFAKVI